MGEIIAIKKNLVFIEKASKSRVKPDGYLPKTTGFS